MHADTRSMLAMNAVGGVAVLGSYWVGLSSESGVGSALWGGVPESLRGLYTVNMFAAAAGYFCFSGYIFFRLDPDRTLIAGRFGYRLFHACYALILFPSALWLPLTERMVAQPGDLLWLAIRVDLALVAAGSAGLLFALVWLQAERPKGRALAILGTLPFVLQTLVLDALIWPAAYPY